MHRVEKQAAFILNSKPYRNSSLWLACFTRDYGRINCIAKGVKGSKGHLAGIVQVFSPLTISWVGSCDLVSLVTAEQRAPAFSFDEIENYFCANYINELLLRLLPVWEPEPELFAAYQQCLASMNQDDHGFSNLRLFELQLLMAIGYGIDWQFDAVQQPIVDDAHYFYQPQSGFTRVSGTHQHAVTGACIKRIAAGKLFDKDGSRAAKQITQQVIRSLLQGKPLNSIESWRAYISSRKQHKAPFSPKLPTILNTILK